MTWHEATGSRVISCNFGKMVECTNYSSSEISSETEICLPMTNNS